jgi:hypothetical protein
MRIFNSLRTGIFRALRSWKGVLIVWFIVFMLVSAFMYPLRSSVDSAFGTSMITEKLSAGFDIEIFADLGPLFKSLVSFFLSGILVAYSAGFILNSFLTGGLFNIVRENEGQFSGREFFRAGALNFWPFLFISLIVTLIIILLGLILIGIPSLIAGASETISEKGAFNLVISGLVVFLVIMPLPVLIADYARAWKTVNGNSSCFRALGFGFSYTFRNFLSSFFTVVPLIMFQIILGYMVLTILSGWRPVTGGGLFILLIISQLMLCLRILLKVWRYASITYLFEGSLKADPVINNS